MRHNYYYLWALFICCLHMLMLAYDVIHPEVFLHMDRVGIRLRAIEGLENSIQQANFVNFLIEHGNPGDYLPQGIIYLSVGRIGLIIFQIGLTLVSGHAVYHIAQNLGLNDKTSAISSGFYLLLPHSLIFPHQLASEAIYTPLLLISIWLVTDSIYAGSAKKAGISGFIIGVANLVRPVTLIWPIVVAILLINVRHVRIAALYLVVALIPVVAWMGFMAVNTGQFTMGESSRDLEHNLYQRIYRISGTMPQNVVEQVHKNYLTQGIQGKISVRQYLRFAQDYPKYFIQHILRDGVIFFGKSGIERVTIDYLSANIENRPLIQNRYSGWRSRLEKEGVGAAIDYLWKTQGIVLITSVFGALLMVMFSLAGCYGAKELLNDRTHMDLSQRFIAVLLIALPIYIFVISQLVDALQSRHRAPAEAALMILSVYGVSNVIKRHKTANITPL